ncbi:uncharacterized protein [Antedon mediterranea]|uniref:uncharacterized protein n=1 Tax=Antedon mediterranea TaxID=105859 RepID=UPI003AF941BF
MTSDSEHQQVFEVCREIGEHLCNLHNVVKVRLPVSAGDVEVVGQQLGLIFKTEFTVTSIKDYVGILTRYCDVMTELGRLLYAMGTSYATNTLYTWHDDLKTKIHEAKNVHKILKEEVAIDSNVDGNDISEYVWTYWFKDTLQARRISLIQHFTKSTGHPKQRTEDALKSFFSTNIIDKQDFKRFFHWMSAKFVTSATDKLLRDSGTSVVNFLSRQRRTGCLRDPLRNPAAVDVKSDAKDDSVHSKFGLDLNREVFPPVQLKSDRSDLPEHIKAELQNIIQQAEAIESCYYGNIAQKDVESLLTSQQRGVFLIRQSSKNPDRLCVSFLHTVPVRSRNSWTEMVRSRNVVLHHDLLCHEVKEEQTPSKKLDWTRTSCQNHVELPNNEIRQKAYTALNSLVEAQTKLLTLLKFHQK